MITIAIIRRHGTVDNHPPDVQLILEEKALICEKTGWFFEHVKKSRQGFLQGGDELINVVDFPKKSHLLTRGKLGNMQETETALKESLLKEETSNLFWAVEFMVQEAVKKAYSVGFDRGLRAGYDKGLKRGLKSKRKQKK